MTFPKNLSFVAALLAFLAMSNEVIAASFNCANASTNVEHLICSVPDLSTLDEVMNKLYRQALPAHPDIGASQVEWRRQRNACTDAACIKASYTERINTLKALVINDLVKSNRPVTSTASPPQPVNNEQGHSVTPQATSPVSQQQPVTEEMDDLTTPQTSAPVAAPEAKKQSDGTKYIIPPSATAPQAIKPAPPTEGWSPVGPLKWFVVIFGMIALIRYHRLIFDWASRKKMANRNDAVSAFLHGVRDTVTRLEKTSLLNQAKASHAEFRVRWLRRLLVATWCFIAFVAVASFCLEIWVINQDFGPPALIDSATCPQPKYSPGVDAAKQNQSYQEYYQCTNEVAIHNRQLQVDYLDRMERNPIVRLLGTSGMEFVRDYIIQLGWFNLVLDLWVFWSLVVVARTWRKRAAGIEVFSGMRWVILSCILILGRPGSWVWSLWFDLIPGWWWLWSVKFGLLPPILLLVTGVITLVSLYFAATALALVLVVFPVKVFQAILSIAGQVTLAKVMKTPLIGSLMQFWLWFNGRAVPPSDAPDDSKGARFAVPKEVAALKKSDGAAFGHYQGAPLTLPNEKHTLIMASTRSGKGVSLIIPHLLRYPGSAFVLDPKGENAKATGRCRSSLNGKVHYLDPFGISSKPRSRFNPLSRFTPENMEAESKALAGALVAGERDHWTASAQQLIAAVMLHVFTSDTIPPSQKDLPKVRRLLLGKMNQVLDEMLESSAGEGLLSDLAASFINTPEKEFGSILSTAQRETEILDNPFMIACLSASGDGKEVNFADWHKDTMTVFLCLSAPKFPVFNRWLRIVLTSALDEMTDKLNPPPLPVCFLLDELATLGHLQSVENAIGLAAGYGIQLVSVFQDVAQMRDLYKGRWASFIGNAGVRAVFNLDDYDTASYWSKFLGGRLVETVSQSQNIYGLTQGQSRSETMRPLLSPEDIMLRFAANPNKDQSSKPRDCMLVLPQGAHPIIAERVGYWDDRELDGLWDDPRKPIREDKPQPEPDVVLT